jgi:hypothetical protein
MADETIPSLPSVATPNSTDLVPIEHGTSGGPYTSSCATIAALVAAGGGGGGGGGVTSLDGETGVITLGSSDSSVTITPTTGHIDLKAAGGGGGGGTIASLDAAQRAISSITNQWRCNDAASATALANSVGANTLSVGSTALVGAPGLLNDSATGVALAGNVATDMLLGAPGTGPATIGPYTLEFLVELLGTPQGTAPGIMGALGDTTASSHLLVAYYVSYGIYVDRDGSDYHGTLPTYFRGLVQMVVDSSNIGTLYLNGVPVLQGANGSAAAGNGAISIGAGTTGANPTAMRVQNIATYSTALTKAQLWANVTAALL